MFIGPIFNGPVTSGAILPLNVVHKKLNIFAGVADVPGRTYVEFELRGPINRTWTERVAPYALFGDIDGDYNGEIMPPGTYYLKASAFDISEGLINFLETNFTVPDVNGILGFEMISSIDKSVSGEGFVTDPLTHDEYLQAGKIPHLVNPKTFVALVPDGFMGSVKMEIHGPSVWGSESRIENFSPYSMFGDRAHLPGADPYDLNFRDLPDGDYLISATPYAMPGGKGAPGLTVSLTISLRHINTTQFEFRSEPFTEFVALEDGTTYFPTEGPFAGITFIKATTALTAGSVVLELKGPINHTQIENNTPYSLFGDTEGVFNGRVFPDGDYTLIARTYSEPDGMGVGGRIDGISFTIDLPEEWNTNIVRMIDVNSSTEIADLETGIGIIDMNDTPTDNVTILVDYECDFDFGNCPGSVSMLLEGQLTISRIENVAPYTLFGDIDGQLNGGYLPVGNYTISITPYWMANATGGPAGPTQVFNFQIIDPEPPPALKLSLFPNPTNANIRLESGQSDKLVTGDILDLSGRVVMTLPENWDGKEPLNISTLKRGVYLMRLQSGDQQTIKKFIVE